MQKIIGFLRNALGLLLYKCIEDPYSAAQTIFREIDPAIRFTFEHDKYDMSDDARVYRRELLIELRNLINMELERGIVYE